MEYDAILLCQRKTKYDAIQTNSTKRNNERHGGKRIVAILVTLVLFLVKDIVINFYKEHPLPDIPFEVKQDLKVMEDFTLLGSIQLEASFLSLGFLVTATMLTLAEVSSTFLLGTVVTAISLVITVTLDCPLADTSVSSVAYSLVSMASIGAVVQLFKEKRLATLSLMMSLSFIGELAMKPLRASLLDAVGYAIAAGILLGSVTVLTLFASLLTVNDALQEPRTVMNKIKSVFPKIYIISPNLLGSFLYSSAVSNIYTHHVPAEANLTMINLSIVLGLCLAGFLSEREVSHPCSMLISVTLGSSLVTTFLVIFKAAEAYYILNFLVGFCLASVTYTLVSLVSWTHLASMMSLMAAVRCLGYVAAPVLTTLLDQDKIDSGFISVGAMLLSSGVYGLIARYRVKDIAEGYMLLEKSIN